MDTHPARPKYEESVHPCPACTERDTVSLTVERTDTRVIWCSQGHVTVNSEAMPAPKQVWNFCEILEELG